LGGVIGAFFNYLNKKMTIFRTRYVNMSLVRRFLELIIISGTFAAISIIFPLMATGTCTSIPKQVATMTAQEQLLLPQLVQLNCPNGFYNQLASLYLVDADTAMQQLFHFQEGGASPTNYVTFDTAALLGFFIPYFLIAAVTSGCLCPAGLFVPTLLAGATYGRLIGHILNSASPGNFADSGTYALIGAAAILGGMSRMTIAGTVIILGK